MKHLKSLLFSLCLFAYGFTIQAQNAIPATGGNATGTGGKVSFTVGQMVYTTNTGTSGSIAQGVQQPYEISVITGIEEAKGINLIISVYPNPAIDILTLKVENYDNQNLSYLLFDMKGILLENKKVTGNQTSISMENRVSGTYFLKVLDDQKEIRTFKIIKNNP
jgi:hypothetical protein